MIDTPCARSQCPEMPKVSLDQAVVDLMESIALQETALSHILCAESRKMQKAMDLDGLDLCKLLEVNDSATNMVHAVANLELVLKDKLVTIFESFYNVRDIIFRNRSPLIIQAKSISFHIIEPYMICSTMFCLCKYQNCSGYSCIWFEYTGWHGNYCL